MSIHQLVRALPLVVAIGCASNATPSDEPTPAAQSAAASNDQSAVVTLAELARDPARGLDLLGALKLVRPRFFAYRGLTSSVDPEAGRVHCSLDGGALRSCDDLRSIQATEVAEVRYLTSSEAAQRWGALSRTGSVIMVKMR